MYDHVVSNSYAWRTARWWSIGLWNRNNTNTNATAMRTHCSNKCPCIRFRIVHFDLNTHTQIDAFQTQRSLMEIELKKFNSFWCSPLTNWTLHHSHRSPIIFPYLHTAQHDCVSHSSVQLSAIHPFRDCILRRWNCERNFVKFGHLNSIHFFGSKNTFWTFWSEEVLMTSWRPNWSEFMCTRKLPL